MKNVFSEHAGILQVFLVILLLVGLPTAVWQDLDDLADANLITKRVAVFLQWRPSGLPSESS